MSNHQLSREERLCSLFTELDLDAGGTLSAKEVSRMEELEMGSNRAAGEHLGAILTEGMDLKTFVSNANAKLPESREAFDTTVDAFFIVVRSVKRAPTVEERLAHLFSELDLDGNGD